MRFAFAALAFGIIYGLVLEVVIVNVIVNQIQDVNTLYTSTPEWSWWVAHSLFGATPRLVGSTLLWQQPAYPGAPQRSSRTSS